MEGQRTKNTHEAFSSLKPNLSKHVISGLLILPFNLILVIDVGSYLHFHCISEAAAQRASKKWKDEGPIYRRTVENEHETVDKNSLETQTGKISSKIPSQRKEKGKQGGPQW